MGAEIISSTPESIYPTSGLNFAPLDPLSQLSDANYSKSSLQDALKKKYDLYRQQDYIPWQESVDIGRIVSNCRAGKLLLIRNAIDNRYMFVQPTGKWADHKTTGGHFQFYSTKLNAEWLSSRPERDPVVPSDDDQIEEFIHGVKIVQDYYDKRLHTTQFETNQCLSAQDFGMWVTRYRYDPQKKDIVGELLPYPACRWDIRYTPEESSHFIYESRESTAVLKRLLHADIMEDDSFPDQYGLQIIDQMGKQGGNVAGYGKEHQFGNWDFNTNETTVTQMWLQPEAYADIEIDKDEGTVCGYPIPAGEDALFKLFPNGLCAVGINEMNTIIGLYGENHKKHIVSGYYHVQSFSGLGKGVSDAVDIMKEMNDLHSQTMAYVKAHGTPSWGYDQSLISEEQARNIGKPSRNIAIDFSNARDGVNNVNQVIQALVPQNPAGSVFQYGDVLNNWLQLAFQVTTFSNGMPGVNNTTATGAQIGEANERMMLVPQHRNKADYYARADKVIFNLFREYCDRKTFFATKDKNAISLGKTFDNNFFQRDVDIEFEIVADSEIPRNRFTKELSMTKFMNFSGGLQGLIQGAEMNPEMTAAVAQAFGATGLPISSPKDIARVCRQRIEQARTILDAEMQNQRMMMALGIQVDTSQLAEQVVMSIPSRVSPGERFVQQKVAWLSEFLDSDEMLFAPLEFRQVVEALMLAHIQGEAYGMGLVQLAQNEGQMMAAKPMMDAQNQQMQAQQEQEMAMQQQQAEASIAQTREQAMAQSEGQMALSVAQHGMKEEAADADFERQASLKELEFEKDASLEAMKMAAAAEEKAKDRTAQSKRGYPSGVKRGK